MYIWFSFALVKQKFSSTEIGCYFSPCKIGKWCDITLRNIEYILRVLFFVCENTKIMTKLSKFSKSKSENHFDGFIEELKNNSVTNYVVNFIHFMFKSNFDFIKTHVLIS